MESLIDRLNQEVILSSEELQNIKRAISMKYASATYNRQQEIFYDHVGQVVDRGLKGLLPSYAFMIKAPILRALWMGKRSKVTRGELLMDILMLNVDRSDLYSIVYRWLQSQQVASVDFKELTDLIGSAYIRQENEIDRSSGIGRWLNYFRTSLTRLNARQVLLGVALVSLVMAGGIFASALAGFIAFGDPEETHWRDAVWTAEAAQDLQMYNEIKLLNYYALKNRNQTELTQAAIKEQYKKLEEQARLRSTTNQEQVALLQQELKANAEKKKKAIRPVLVISVSQTRWIQLSYAKNHEPQSMPSVQLPDFMSYEFFNQALLKQYLDQKNSILSDPDYFNVIVSAAKTHDIDPRFLFAIAGQEQSLVKRSNPNASKIANNPFNVYNSWQKYNTSIADSSEIVCNTIVNRMAKWDGTGDPIQWLNKSYAEDLNWHYGVKRYYELLVKATQ